ncbi:MAG: RNA polymerase sigma-I factor [Clostridia bacterium]|nr:RNA polymerase sigma-I factor [Clostridia bacterium]
MRGIDLFNRNQFKDNSVYNTLEKIKKGERHLKEQFIHEYTPFILKVVSQALGKYIDEQNEEYSIGLSAFNEAIDRFDINRNDNFFNYSERVIKSRIIDYVRKNQKDFNTFPFTYFENDENKDFEEKYLRCDEDRVFEYIEVKEELEQIHRKLSDFGISLKDLALSAPKHTDSKQLCIRIARILAEDDELYWEFIRKRNIPKTHLSKVVNVNKKTIERNRCFIIAASLILRSNLETMKGYLIEMEKGGTNRVY